LQEELANPAGMSKAHVPIDAKARREQRLGQAPQAGQPGALSLWVIRQWKPVQHGCFSPAAGLPALAD